MENLVWKCIFESDNESVYFFLQRRSLLALSTWDDGGWNKNAFRFSVSGKHCFHKINFWSVARFLFKRVFKFLFLLIILCIFCIIILKPRYNFFYRKILFFVNIKINKRKQNIKQFYSQNQILKKRIFKIFNCITFQF